MEDIKVEKAKLDSFFQGIQIKFAVETTSQRFYFFTRAGAETYLSGELKGEGKLIEL